MSTNTCINCGFALESFGAATVGVPCSDHRGPSNTATILTDSPGLTKATLCGKTLTLSPNRHGDPVWCHEDGTPCGDTFYLVLEKALREYRAKGAA